MKAGSLVPKKINKKNKGRQVRPIAQKNTDKQGARLAGLEGQGLVCIVCNKQSDGNTEIIKGKCHNYHVTWLFDYVKKTTKIGKAYFTCPGKRCNKSIPKPTINYVLPGKYIWTYLAI